jgi:transposase
MRKEHEPHEWKEGRRKLSLGTVSTGVEAERVSYGPGMCKGTASLLLNRAKGEGIVGLRHALAPGSQPKLSAEQLAQLPQVLAQGAEAFGYRGQVWTTRRGADVSKRQVQAHLTGEATAASQRGTTAVYHSGWLSCFVLSAQVNQRTT